MDLDKEKTVITEKYWKLKTLFGQEVKKNEPQNRAAFFQLNADGKMVGFTGCNSMNGSYNLSGLQINFSEIASTKMMCHPNLTENGFLKAINSADNYSLSEDGKTLSLNKAKMAPMAIFELAENDETTAQNTFDLEKEKEAVTEKYWKLETLRGKKVTMTETQEREAFFRLTSAGRLTGFSGCNAMSGEYKLQEGFRIKFDKVAVSMKMCEEGIDERGFLDAINEADNYTLSNNDESLSLNKARMAPLATFKAVYF